MKKNQVVQLVFDLFLGIIVLYEWGQMLFRASGGMLASVGLWSLQYFTVLSNLLESIACFVLAACTVSGKGLRKAWTLKYVAAVSVVITFLVVLVFLGPLFGYGQMYVGANFWFHLMVPVLAMGEYVVCSSEELPGAKSFLGLVPVSLYAGFYMARVFKHISEENWRRLDFYGFFTWGVVPAFGLLVVLLAVAILIGFALRRGNRAFRRNR